MRERMLVAAVALLAAGAAFTVAIAPQPTTAAWPSTKVFTASATAATPTRPTALTCTAGSGLLSGSIPFTWTAPAGSAPSGYTLKWTGAATGQASFTTTSGSVPASALLGTLSVSVHADYGAWQSLAGTQTRQTTIVLAGVLWGCS